MRARWATFVALTLILVLVVAAPASATLVQSSRAVVGGEVVTLNCPEGERFWSGTATFYRYKPGSHGNWVSMATVPMTTTPDGLGGMATAPKGARWVTIDLWCANTVQVKQNVGSTSDYVYFYCPPEMPYLTSVAWPVVADVDGDFSTTDDQFRPPYVTASFGAGGSISAGPVDPGVYVRAVFTCSATSG